MSPVLRTVADVAERLGTTTRAVVGFARRLELPYVDIGPDTAARSKRFRSEYARFSDTDIEMFIQKRRRVPTAADAPALTLVSRPVKKHAGGRYA